MDDRKLEKIKKLLNLALDERASVGERLSSFLRVSDIIKACTGKDITPFILNSLPASKVKDEPEIRVSVDASVKSPDGSWKEWNPSSYPESGPSHGRFYWTRGDPEESSISSTYIYRVPTIEESHRQIPASIFFKLGRVKVAHRSGLIEGLYDDNSRKFLDECFQRSSMSYKLSPKQLAWLDKLWNEFLDFIPEPYLRNEESIYRACKREFWSKFEVIYDRDD